MVTDPGTWPLDKLLKPHSFFHTISMGAWGDRPLFTARQVAGLMKLVQKDPQVLKQFADSVRNFQNDIFV